MIYFRKGSIDLRQPLEELVALRNELALHPDVAQEGMKGSTFEECLAQIGAKLNIVLDGEYDVGELCSMLTEALRNRPADKTLPPVIAGLQTVELVETDNEISMLPVLDSDWQKEFAHRRDDEGKDAPYTVCD